MFVAFFSSSLFGGRGYTRDIRGWIVSRCGEAATVGFTDRHPIMEYSDRLQASDQRGGDDVIGGGDITPITTRFRQKDDDARG